MLTDLRLAVRTLRRTPGFAAAAIVTLALGIGATTAIFSVVDAMLLRPLPYRDAARLVSVWSHREDPTADIPPSYADFDDWRHALAAPGGPVASLAFARSEGLLLRGADGAVELNVAFVSDGFFRTLGGPPLLGRTFTADEERAGGARAIVLGWRLWQGRFGADPSVVGRTLDFASGSYTVVGVMGPGWEYPGRWAEAWAPLAPLAADDRVVRERLARRDVRVDARVVARLAPGASERVARAAIVAAARATAAAHPEPGRPWSAHAVSLREQMVATLRPTLLVLLSAVGLLLLIGCADVANLSLVRALARARELSVRAAMGATRARLARQLLAESAVVALAGGALGAGLAVAGVAALRRFAPPAADTLAPSLDAAAVDGRVLAFALAVAAATAVLFGVVPALHATRAGAGGALREGARGADAGGSGRRARDAAVALQIALTLVLLVGAGLLGRSFLNLRARGVGFPMERLTILRVQPPAARYDSPEKLVALYERLRAEAAALPGARSAAVVNHLAMAGGAIPTDVRVPGAPDSLRALFRVADGAYFATAGIPVRRGRALTDADVAAAARPGAVDVAVVVSAELARQAWPRGTALGQRLTVFKQASGRPDYGAAVPGVVVGVADEVRMSSLEETSPIPAVYVPTTVNPWRWAFLVVRTDGDPAALVAPLRRVVRGVDADIPVADATTGAERLRGATAERRFNLAIVGAFAASALALAALGLYAVVAHGVGQRRGELGVRAVLGALPGQQVRLVLREGARVAAVGLAAGLALALAGARLVAGLLFGVAARDPATFAAVTALLAAVALVAAFVPARRAAAVAPAAALRGE